MYHTLTGRVYKKASELLYSEIPMYYIWNMNTSARIRRTSPHYSDCLTRVQFIHFGAGDVFYLRELLHHRVYGKGHTSYAKHLIVVALRTFFVL